MRSFTHRKPFRRIIKRLAKARPKKWRVHVPRTCLPVRVHNERQRRIHPPLPRPFRISQLPQDLRRAGRGAAGTYGAVCLLLEAISSGEGGCRVTQGHFHNSAVRILRGRAARIEQQRATEAARTLLVLEVLSLSLSSLVFLLSFFSITSLSFASTFSDLRFFLWLTVYPLLRPSL